MMVMMIMMASEAVIRRHIIHCITPFHVRRGIVVVVGGVVAAFGVISSVTASVSGLVMMVMISMVIVTINGSGRIRGCT